MRKINPLHQLPLDELLLRLELAGFTISPADRLRIWQVLSGPGKTTLRDPRKLKYMLAPVIARGEAGQERFYSIFDTYMDEVFAETPTSRESAREIKWWHWLLGIVTLVLLGWAIRMVVTERVLPAPVASLGAPSSAAIGDTIRLQNQSTLGGDTTDFKVYWEWRDALTNKLEIIDSQSYHWNLIVPTPADTFYRKKVILRLAAREGVRYRESNALIDEHELLIHCPFTPDVTTITGLPSNEMDMVDTLQSLQLEPDGSQGPWLYNWDFGDGTQASGRQQTHTYQKPGKYSIRLLVRDTSAAGFCSVDIRKSVNVGSVKAYAYLLPLRMDWQHPQAVFSWGYWTLLSLLGIGMLYYWARWVSRQPPPKPVSADGSIAARFKVNDKAPYFIPFRSPAALLPLAPQQYRLAEAMRHRQTGFRRGIDIPQTLQATINRAGYPSIRFAYNTRPSEYLILVDEQADLSHLGQLFQHLATSLRGQDVHADIYYYRRHFNRFWNKYVPDGLSAELLRRRYPGHRLLILGDAHDLLDPHAKGRPSLRKEYVTILRQWPDRLLLTPVPPVSWTYREKQLAHFAALYPADLAGLAEATHYLEVDADPPSEDFALWQQKQTENRQDTDSEYRNWKRLQDHQAYLADDPALWNWFLALAVFPTPTWEITIAIGHALGGTSDLLSYDNLLRLARIPSLQTGRWSARLQREMLKALDPATEKIARAAVRAELDAVRAETRQGHAGIQLETELAIQDFALQPKKEEHQDTLRYLLKNNMLSPAQIAGLNQVVQTAEAKQDTSGAAKKAKSSIHTVLGIHQEGAEEAKEKPAQKIHPLFWKALAATFVFLLVFVAFWQLSGTDTLYEWVYGEDHARLVHTTDENLDRGIFVKETLQIDSAVVYNNYGVNLTQSTQDYRITGPFRLALDWRDGRYPLAKANLLKSNYNTAATLYNDYLNDKIFPYQLDTIHKYLRNAVTEYTLTPTGILISDDSTGRDVQHLEGMIAYYEGKRDLAQNYHDALAGVGFFDTLQVLPNLATLLDLARTQILSVATNETEDNATIVTVNSFIDDQPDTTLSVWAFLDATNLNAATVPDTQRTTIEGTDAQNVEFIFMPTAQTTGTSDLLYVQIRDASGTVLDEKKQPLEKSWGIATTKPQSQRYRGTVIDAISKKPIPRAQIVVQTRQPDGRDKNMIDPVFTDREGRYDFSLQSTTGKRGVAKMWVTAKNYHTRGFASYEGQPILKIDVPSQISLSPVTPSEDVSDVLAKPETILPTTEGKGSATKQTSPDYTAGTPEYRKTFSGQVVDAQTGTPIRWSEAFILGAAKSGSVYTADADGQMNFPLPASGLTAPLTYVFVAEGYYPVRVDWRELALENTTTIRLARAYTLEHLMNAVSSDPYPFVCVSCDIPTAKGLTTYQDCFYDMVAARRTILSWATQIRGQPLCRFMPIEEQIKEIKPGPAGVEYLLVNSLVTPAGYQETAPVYTDRTTSIGDLSKDIPTAKALVREFAEKGYASSITIVAVSLTGNKK